MVELRPEEVETLRRKHNAEANMSDKDGVRMRQNMTSFSAAQQATKLYNSNNRRGAGQRAGGQSQQQQIEQFLAGSKLQVNTERFLQNLSQNLSKFRFIT